MPAGDPAQLQLTLRLPRDVASIRLSRRVVEGTLAGLQVSPDCQETILLALSEACTNAVAHAAPAEGYVVEVAVQDSECAIVVTDTGHGFTVELPVRQPPITQERGRGLYLMATASDALDVCSSPAGTRVMLRKFLQFDPQP